MSKLLIVGVNQPGHVATFLSAAATKLGHQATILDSTHAMGSWHLVQSPLWRLAHWPLHLQRFSQTMLRLVEQLQPQLVITTGLAPLTPGSLRALQCRGLPTLNYSTDDPWNRAHRSRWFLQGIPFYSRIFSTRKAALPDFYRAGAQDVSWLPFGYCPDHHYPDPGEPVASEANAIAFVGGADADRVALLKPLLNVDLPLALWGGYWDRKSLTRPHAHGFASAAQLRRILSNTACALTLVRRANRDGHAMRSLEVAAMAAPVLAEDTLEHRQLYGQEGENALYFRNSDDLITRARWLLSHRAEGRCMGERLRIAIHEGNHTYADRLTIMLNSC